MAKKTNFSDEVQVAHYLKKSDHPLGDVVIELRRIILSTDNEIGEQIKWNSPAFYYTGYMKSFDPKEYKRDIVVFNLRKKELVLLVFPTGATIQNDAGLLQGNFTDGRKTAAFSSLKEVKAFEHGLRSVLKQWLSLVEK